MGVPEVNSWLVWEWARLNGPWRNEDRGFNFTWVPSGRDDEGVPGSGVGSVLGNESETRWCRTYISYLVQ